MNVFAKITTFFAIFLITAFFQGTTLAFPVDYSVYPHLAETVPLQGDNRAIEGFSLWGSDYFAVCNQESGVFLFQVMGDELDQVGAINVIGQEKDIAIVAWFGFVATNAGLTALSLANPQAPLSLGFLSLPGGDIQQVEVSPTHAYVACGVQGLAIVNITASTMLVEAWYSGDVESVSLDGNRLGVTNNGRFELLDVTVASAPVLLGYCETISHFDYISAVLQGTTVYSMTETQVDRWDFTDPGAPVLDSPVPFLLMPYSPAGSVRIQGSEMQVVGKRYLCFFDFYMGILLRETRQIGEALDADVHGGLLVTGITDAVQVFRNGIHGHPLPDGAFDMPGNMFPVGILLGDILYGESLTQPSTLTAVDLNGGTAHLWDVELGLSYIHSFDHRENLIAIMGGQPFSVKLVTASRYGATTRGSIDLPDLDPPYYNYDPVYNTYGTNSYFLGNDYLVLLDRRVGEDPANIRVVDVANPDAPVVAYTLDLDSFNEDIATVKVAGSVILVGNHLNLAIIDAQDPLNLVQVGTLALGTRYFFTWGEWLYSVHSASFGAVLKVWDLSDPGQPLVTAELPLAALEDFRCAANFAYQDESGLILDLSDPAHPVPAGNLSLANSTVNPMDRIIAGDQYILAGRIRRIEPFKPLHYLATQGGTGEVSAVREDIQAANFDLNLRATPNPFNPRVILQFELSTAAVTRIDVFDVRGRLVAIIGEKRREAGFHDVAWDGTDREGRDLPSGVYLARVKAGDESDSLKIVLAR